MKILVVTNLYAPDERGGYEVLCRQVVERLASRGHDVVVLTTGRAMPPGAVRVRRDLALTEPFTEAPTLRSRRSRTVSARNRAATAAALREEQPDVVFFWSQRRLTLGPALAAQMLGWPRLFTLNDPWPCAYAPRAVAASPKALASALLDRTWWRECTTERLEPCPSVAISRSLQRELVDAGPFADAELLYQGVPLERFAAAERRGRGKRLLYVGQLYDYKGPHIAVEAAARLRASHPDVSLTLVGDGDPDYVQRLLRAGEKAGIDLRWRGRRPHDEMPEIYAEHDVFLFTSLWDEPFGLTHLEAMANGMAVIATPTGGTAELLALDDGHMRSVPPGNADALAECIGELFADPAGTDRMAARGREVVMEQFSIDRYVAAFEARLLTLVTQEVAA